MKAQEHLDAAAGLVGGDRARHDCDVLVMMALLKIARTRHGEFNRDDWVDALGYVALAGQVAEEDHEQETLERRAAEAPVYR